MMYAPLRGVELPVRRFVPSLPLPAEHEAWRDSVRAARQFWERAQPEPRLPRSFRELCGESARTVQAVMRA